MVELILNTKGFCVLAPGKPGCGFSEPSCFFCPTVAMLRNVGGVRESF